MEWMAEQFGARRPLGPAPNVPRLGEALVGQWQLASPPAACGACGEGGGDAAGHMPPRKRRSRNPTLPSPGEITPALRAVTAAVFILKNDGEGDVTLAMWQVRPSHDARRPPLHNTYTECALPQNLMRRALLLDPRIGRVLDNSTLMAFIRKDTLLDDYLNSFPTHSHLSSTLQISRRAAPHITHRLPARAT